MYTPRMVNRMVRVVYVSVVVFAIGSCVSSQNRWETDVEPWLNEVFENDIKEFEHADREQGYPAGEVLFIGSSSIKLWETLERDFAPLPVVNRGFGGSQTPEVLAVFDRIVVPRAPRVIVYYCGDNDIGLGTTDARGAADGFIAFDQEARRLWANVEVIYIPIKPSLARWGSWDEMEKANSIVASYCADTDGAWYADTVSPTLLGDGTPDPAIFLGDGLHLNPEGYRRWVDVVRPMVQRSWDR